MNKIIVFSLVILFILTTKGLTGITLLKDHWYGYLIGILFINLGWVLSKKKSSLKKIVKGSYLVAVGVILLTGLLRIGEHANYNYTYSPDYHHRLVLKEISTGKPRGGSVLEIHEQFGIFKKKKGSIYIKKAGNALTIELPRENGNVFKPQKEFVIGGIRFLWETNNILHMNFIPTHNYKPEEIKFSNNWLFR
nr:hypothetical protein [uncultured Niameybacter sp.]